MSLGSKIKANNNQKGNPVLRYIKLVPFEFADVEPDFVLGESTCCLYLSLRYHSFHPEYLANRIYKLGPGYQIRVLLVLVDMQESKELIRELTLVSIKDKFTMICAWSEEEVAIYLEEYKTMENAPPDLIREKVDANGLSNLTAALTEIKSVNKTDVMTLVSNYGSLYHVINAQRDEIALLPGFGISKTNRLMDSFDCNFESEI